MTRSAISRFILSASLLALAAPLAAQNQTAPSQPDIVGPPALENFDLGGDRIVAAPPPPPPAEAQPVTVVPAPPSPAATTRRPAESRDATPRPREQAAAAPRQVTTFAPEAAEAAPNGNVPVAPELSAPPPPPLPAPEPPQGSTVSAATAESENDGVPWWAAVAGGILLLGAGVYFGRRRSLPSASTERDVPAEPVSRPAPGPVPKAMPVAATAPPVADGPRASVELIFEPTSTVLGEKEAIVHFLLTVHNAGDLPAKNVRLEARVFNAGMSVDTDIGAFFAAPLQRRVVTLPQALPTGERFGIQGEVPIPIADIRPIEVEGRKLFIPIVAVTAIYEFEGGSGQTSKSYMVGVEAGQAGKMGPFRLDQGPRVYRSVGQRAHRLVKTA